MRLVGKLTEKKKGKRVIEKKNCENRILNFFFLKNFEMKVKKKKGIFGI